MIKRGVRHDETPNDVSGGGVGAQGRHEPPGVPCTRQSHTPPMTHSPGQRAPIKTVTPSPFPEAYGMKAQTTMPSERERNPPYCALQKKIPRIHRHTQMEKLISPDTIVLEHQPGNRASLGGPFQGTYPSGGLPPPRSHTKIALPLPEGPRCRDRCR